MAAPVVSILQGDYQHEIAVAAQMLREGKLVVLPTETVYGAAGVLDDPTARQRLRVLRDGNDVKPNPFIPHLSEPAQAMEYLGTVSELGRRMMRKLWPGPVALVFDVPEERQRAVAGKLGVAVEDLYGDGRITLRCPDHGVALEVIAAVGRPVVMVRAGVQSRRPALRAEDVADELEGQVDLILDAGPSRFSKPSTIVHVKNDSYEVLRSGVYDQRILQRMLRTTILFVCSGNTCRSPMAEGLARRILADKLGVAADELEKKGVSVMSAGAMAMPGARATPQAVEALRRMGVDLTPHRSKPLSVELIHQADLIYTMGRNHGQVIRAMVPSAAEKTTTLVPDRDVDDPIGGDLDLYVNLAQQLEGLIETRLAEQPIP